MKKIDVKKCVLYISLLPYVVVLVMSIYYAIAGYDYGLQDVELVYGIRAGIGFLGEFWEYNFGFNFILLILCVSYQAYYLITSKRKEQKVDNENSGSIKDKINIKQILFVISILCWVAYFLFAIHGFFFGATMSDGLFSDNTKTYYGIEALKSNLFWTGLIFTYIPVLPLTLIYIIGYTLAKIKEKNTNFSIKKLFLYISLIPYLYFVFMCIYSAIFGYEYFYNELRYGLRGTIDFIDDFLWGNFVEFNFVGGLVILCIGYQVYYFISSKKRKNKDLEINDYK